MRVNWGEGEGAGGGVRFSRNDHIYKNGHNVENGSPDMILVAFERKFDETKNEIPPRVCRPSTKLKKNNVEKVDPQKVKKNAPG